MQNLDYFQLVLVGSLILVTAAILLVLVFLYAKKRIVEEITAKNKIEIDYQKKVRETLIISQEEERKRIAQDLHDDVCSKLNVIQLYSQLLQKNEISKNEKDEILQKVVQESNNALDTSRKISHNLMPASLTKLGLEKSLLELINLLKSVSNLNFHLNYNLNELELPNDKEIHMFRITQELFNNSKKHAKANNINIEIHNHGKIVKFNYSDDGIGFDVSKIQNKNGIGITSIESRVDILDGKSQWHSDKGKGTQFKMEFSI